MFFYFIYKILQKQFITTNNLEFINDIYKKLQYNQKNKFDKIVTWHRIYNHPLLIERSIKINTFNKSINKNRMTIIISLSYFFKDLKGTIDEIKWIQWKQILNLPNDIEKKIIKYLISGNGLVDFIWGIDLDEKKEKIYLENSNENKIYCYIFLKKKKNTFIYNKISKSSKHFRFYYKRKNKENKIDSYHFFLKKVIRINNNIIHIISISKNSITIYYYSSFISNYSLMKWGLI
jgi:hypothetical protein